MTDIFAGPPDSTPLTPDEQEGLIPTWIATRADLNAAERDNIAAATRWARRRRWKPEGVTQPWLKELHRRMFFEVWRWAGTYRTHDTNIGVPWHQVVVAVEGVVRDMHAQIGTTSSGDEVAVRFHHRLVAIHPFPNGNGRHARLATDVLVESLGEPRFTWGAGAPLEDRGTARADYLDALRIADGEGDYAPLLAFARG